MKLINLRLTTLLFIIFNIVATISNGGDIIPDERRIDWSHCGVPGGIPDRKTIFIKIDSTIYGNGDIDATEAIRNAIYFCPEGQVIYIPEGRYKFDNTVSFKFKSHITIRGAGPDKTIILPAGRAFQLGDDFQNPSDIQILGGATKGSTKLVLSDASSLHINDMLKIDRDNDTNLVVSVGGYQRLISQMLMITAIEGNSITISPALFWDFSINPKLTNFTGTDYVIKFSGIEDLTIDHTNGGDGVSFFLNQCYGCWIKNIASIKPGKWHSVEVNNLNCEIRDSYFYDSKTYGPDNGGITMWGTNTAFKIENNIFNKCFPGIELANSSSGNYLGYNFGINVEGGNDWSMSAGDFNDNHSPHNMMNLWEGNVCEMFQSDGYFGSGSHGTLFRNNFTGTHAIYLGNYKAICLNRWSYYYNIVGNVLGVPDYKPDYYEVDINGYPYEKSTIYQLGYPNMGNNYYSGTNPPDTNIEALDLKVKQTILRHGNFDFFNNNVIWDSTIIEKYLPTSLYYTAKPSWWPDNVPWPPIGPDVPGFINKIPAELRFYGYPTSVDRPHSENGLSLEIFPSPATEKVHLSFHINESGPVNFKIYDFIGTQVKSLFKYCSESGNYSTNFDVSDLSSGIYIIKTNIGNQFLFKIIILLR